MIDFSVYLPPPTPVELPSKGLLYAPGSGLESGFVTIREYAGPEEALLATANEENWHIVINNMLKNCISEAVNVEDLTNEDAFYLITWLRANSFTSPLFHVEAECAYRDCKHLDKYAINLATDLTHYTLDADVTEPLEVYLPKTKLTVYIRCMRRGTEVRAQRRAADTEAWRHYKGDPTDLLRRAYSITRVIEPSGNETTDILDIEKLCLYYMPSGDSLVLDKALEKFRHGIDMNLILHCTACERDLPARLPFSIDFFRPTL